MQTYKTILLLIGRICIALLFIWAGASKLMDWEGTKLYMASKQMPFISFFLPVAVLIQLIGGALLFPSATARYGAAILIAFIIPASLIFHNFWDVIEPERLTEQVNFMKDLAILGGLLQIAVLGSGSYSIEKLLTFNKFK